MVTEISWKVIKGEWDQVSKKERAVIDREVLSPLAIAGGDSGGVVFCLQ